MRLFSLARLKEKILAHTGMSLLSTTMGVAMLGCATVAYATASANLSHAEMDGQSLKIRNILNDFYDDVKKTKYTEIEEKYQNKKFENLDNDVYVKTTIDKKCGKGTGKNTEICPFVKVVARVFAKSDVNGENELDRIEVNRTFSKYFDRPRVFTKDDTLELGEDAVGIRFFAKAQDGEDGQSCGVEDSNKIIVPGFEETPLPKSPTREGEIGKCGILYDNGSTTAVTDAGGKGLYYKFIPLGDKEQDIFVESHHFDVPDRFRIFYDGKKVYDTGEQEEIHTSLYNFCFGNGPKYHIDESLKLTSGTRGILFHYHPNINKPKYLLLEMDAPAKGTVWAFIAACDENNINITKQEIMDEYYKIQKQAIENHISLPQQPFKQEICELKDWLGRETEDNNNYGYSYIGSYVNPNKIEIDL